MRSLQECGAHDGGFDLGCKSGETAVRLLFVVAARDWPQISTNVAVRAIVNCMVMI